MGYGYYTLSDGREAGYGVEADCDREGCTERIDRGLGYLCGDNPYGHSDPDEPGCGFYFCGEHEYDHDCPDPACDLYEADGERGRSGCCTLVKGHELPHYDRSIDHEFEDVEETS